MFQTDYYIEEKSALLEQRLSTPIQVLKLSMRQHAQVMKKDGGEMAGLVVSINSCLLNHSLNCYCMHIYLCALKAISQATDCKKIFVQNLRFNIFTHGQREKEIHIS